jgi:YgiT-type zinc finger domain-containing protein
MGKAWADWEAEWQALSEEAYSGMADWRAAHPRATFAEIEAAVEERLAGLRTRMLERAALASAATELRERSACPQCGGAVQARGKRTRRLTVPGDQVVELERTYAVCPQCGTGLFPPG